MELITLGNDSIILSRDCRCLYGLWGKGNPCAFSKPLDRPVGLWSKTGSDEDLWSKGCVGSRASSLCFGRCGGEWKSLFVLPFWRNQVWGWWDIRGPRLVWRRGKEAWFRSPHPLSAQVPGLRNNSFSISCPYEFFHVCFSLILGCNPEVCCNISQLIISAKTTKVCLQTLLWPDHFDPVLWNGSYKDENTEWLRFSW